MTIITFTLLPLEVFIVQIIMEAVGPILAEIHAAILKSRKWFRMEQIYIYVPIMKAFLIPPAMENHGGAALIKHMILILIQLHHRKILSLRLQLILIISLQDCLPHQILV